MLHKRKHTVLIYNPRGGKIPSVVEDASGKVECRLTRKRHEGKFWGDDILCLDRALGDTGVKHLPKSRECTFIICAFHCM